MQSLSKYRKGVIGEFNRRKAVILYALRLREPRVLDVDLCGSVLSPKAFREDSDIDLLVTLPAGLTDEELESIAERLRGQIIIGGGMADVVPRTITHNLH